MIDVILKGLFEQGGGYILAALAILVIYWISNLRVADMKESKADQAEWKETAIKWAVDERGDKLLLLQAYQDNAQSHAAAMIKLTMLLETQQEYNKQYQAMMADKADEILRGVGDANKQLMMQGRKAAKVERPA